MEIRYTPSPNEFKKMNTTELRKIFLIERLFMPGKIHLVSSDNDRAIIGSVVPTHVKLELERNLTMKVKYFAENREVGVINIGGKGRIVVDGATYDMDRLDALYIGRGNKYIDFRSHDTKDPAKFYIVSYPAHTEHPTTHAPLSKADPIKLGSAKECNQRTIYKYIHPDGIQSCQLVMGCTLMEEGSVWNTMPAHTHERRSEVYMYFDVPDGAAVFHFMGEPKETRHIVVEDGEAILSPSWSIHCGAGTTNYSFVWAMGGENQDFSDMDGVTVDNMM